LFTFLTLKRRQVCSKNIEDTKAFCPLNGHLMPIPIKRCEAYIFYSHEYFACLAREIAVSAYEYSGTAHIGIEIIWILIKLRLFISKRKRKAKTARIIWERGLYINKTESIRRQFEIFKSKICATTTEKIFRQSVAFATNS